MNDKIIHLENTHCNKTQRRIVKTHARTIAPVRHRQMGGCTIQNHTRELADSLCHAIDNKLYATISLVQWLITSAKKDVRYSIIATFEYKR